MFANNSQNDFFDIEAAVKTMCGKFPQILSVYIFGSRRFGTKSTRSDIDILLLCDNYVKKSDLRNFVIEHKTALDLFVIENGRAESVANESYIQKNTTEELISALDAVEIYTRGRGSSQFLTENKNQIIDRRVDFKLTVLPGTSNECYEVQSLQKFFAAARENKLPSRPYIGISTLEATEFLISVIREIPTANLNVSGHGLARKGWTINIASEYDFQNLFWITVKPWLHDLTREEVTIKYDGRDKIADFSLFGSQLIIEFKHIKDNGDIRETTKTLKGLSEFYMCHPNVRVLLFAILVNKNINFDDRKIEENYSYENKNQVVKTIVIRNNA